MVRSLRSETECLWLVLSSSCDIVPVTCSLVLPSVLVLDLLALRSIPHPSLLVLMSQQGWPWNLCFLGSYTNQLTSGWVSLLEVLVQDWRVGRKEEPGCFPFFLHVFYLKLRLYLFHDPQLTMIPASARWPWLLGTLLCPSYLWGGSNFLPWLTSGVTPGYPCSFSRFYLLYNHFLILNSFYFRPLE